MPSMGASIPSGLDMPSSRVYHSGWLAIETCTTVEPPGRIEKPGGRMMAGTSLYERLGGAFAIAAVVDHFSDALIDNPIAGRPSANPELRDWHTNQLARLPGLKFMRTLWVCAVSGGPFVYTPTRPGETTL